MNAPSVAVLVVLGLLVCLAVRRAWKKGAPCECGCNCGTCGSCGRGHAHAETEK